MLKCRVCFPLIPIISAIHAIRAIYLATGAVFHPPRREEDGARRGEALDEAAEAGGVSVVWRC